jgi:hypothetical protein
MSIAKAHSLKQVYQMLNSGKYSEIELAFDVDADAFFNSQPNIVTTARKLPVMKITSSLSSKKWRFRSSINTLSPRKCDVSRKAQCAAP